MQGCERVDASYQFEGPNTTKATQRRKEENEKTVEDKMWESSSGQQRSMTILSNPASPTPSNTLSRRSFHRDTEWGIKVCEVCRTVRFCSEVQKNTDERPRHHVKPVLEQKARAEHHKVAVLGYSWSYEAYTKLQLVDSGKGCTQLDLSIPPAKKLTPLTI